MTARPAPTPPSALPSWLRLTGDAVHLQLKVQPRASRAEVLGAAAGELRLRVTAPPVESAANAAVLGLLAERLGCPRGAVTLVRGGASRHKVVAVRGLSAAEVVRRLLKAS